MRDMRMRHVLSRLFLLDLLGRVTNLRGHCNCPVDKWNIVSQVFHTHGLRLWIELQPQAISRHATLAFPALCPCFAKITLPHCRATVQLPSACKIPANMKCKQTSCTCSRNISQCRSSYHCHHANMSCVTVCMRIIKQTGGGTCILQAWPSAAQQRRHLPAAGPDELQCQNVLACSEHSEHVYAC